MDKIVAAQLRRNHADARKFFAFLGYGVISKRKGLEVLKAVEKPL